MADLALPAFELLDVPVAWDPPRTLRRNPRIERRSFELLDAPAACESLAVVAEPDRAITPIEAVCDSQQGNSSAPKTVSARLAVNLAAEECLQRLATQSGKQIRWGLEATVVAVAVKEPEKIVCLCEPSALIAWLRLLHVSVDGLAEREELVKLNNNGFEFQVVSGHFDEPKADSSSHAGRALSFARALIPLAEGLALPGNSGFVQFGISIHTGTISSETLYGVDWIMFRLLGRDASVAPRILEKARAGYILGTASFVRTLGDAAYWRPCETMRIGWEGPLVQLLELGPAELERYGSVQRLTSLPWRRPPRQASNWVEALLFTAIRRTRLALHMAKVLREAILQRVMPESKVDSRMYPGASIGTLSLLGGGATSADDPVMPNGLPSTVPHWIEGEPALSMAEFLQGVGFPPPRNMEGLPRRPRARAQFDLADLHFRLEEVQASRMRQIALMGEDRVMLTWAGERTGETQLMLREIRAVAQREICPAPWDFGLVRRGPEAPVEDVARLAKTLPQLSEDVLAGPYVKPHLFMRFPDRQMEADFEIWEAGTLHTSTFTQLFRRAQAGELDIVTCLETVIHCLMIIIMGICMHLAQRHYDPWYLLLVNWRLLPMGLFIVPIGWRKQYRYPLLGLLRIGFMMSFAYQFIWSLESPMGDPTMVWGKRLLLANKVIFYPVHGLEVQIHLQLPLHLFASLEMVVFGTILAVDWNHCTRAALGGRVLGECASGAFPFWVLAQFVAVVCFPAALVWWKERRARTAYLRQRSRRKAY